MSLSPEVFYCPADQGRSTNRPIQWIIKADTDIAGIGVGLSIYVHDIASSFSK